MTKQRTSEAPSPPIQADAPILSKGETAYLRYALLIFLLCHAVKGLDSQAFSILLPPIKAEFGLTDTRMGLISGLSFAVFFALIGIPIGRLADRSNRRNIIAVMLSLFSFAALAGGVATNFWQLALSRMGVGLGQGGVAPPIHSMIADMFPVRRRSSAMAFYAAGSYVGAGVGFLLCGWISQFYGWRVAMIACGIPGLLLALTMMLTLREPVRGASDGLAETAHAAPRGTLLEAARFMWSQRAFRHIVLASGLTAIGTNAFVAWMPSYLSRSYAMTQGQIGTALALIAFIVAGGGTLLSGRIVDYVGRNDIRRGLWLIGVIQTIKFPVAAMVALAQGPVVGLVFYVFLMWGTSFHMAPTSAYVQSLAPVRFRATASSLMYLFFTVVGPGGGPLIIGVLSDYFSAEHGNHSVRYALLVTTFVYLWAAVHYYLGSRTIREDIARAKALG